MASLILALLPPAVAMAINPVPIIGVIAMLSTDKPLRSGGLYVATMIFVVAGIGVLSLLVLNQALGAAGSSGSSGGLQVLFGMLFLSLAFMQWRAQARTGSGDQGAELDEDDGQGRAVRRRHPGSRARGTTRWSAARPRIS